MRTYLQTGWEEALGNKKARARAREPFRFLSGWSQSRSKRWFDVLCVVTALPVLLPVCVVLALIVYCSSPGPVLFVQKRVGRNGQIFRIYKFRTIQYTADRSQSSLTTAKNQAFTSAGPFLRRWKLDELPQLFNVLTGDMSLVGPRPKLPEFVRHNFPCRPGVTGAASLAFAREETVLARIPPNELDRFYHSVVLPTKRNLDAEYMSRATMLSDIKLILHSVVSLCDDSYLTRLIECTGRPSSGYEQGEAFGD